MIDKSELIADYARLYGYDCYPMGEYRVVGIDKEILILAHGNDPLKIPVACCFCPDLLKATTMVGDLLLISSEMNSFQVLESMYNKGKDNTIWWDQPL